MQYRIIFVTALSATGALAHPAIRRQEENMNGDQPNPTDGEVQGGFPDIDFNQFQCPQPGQQEGEQMQRRQAPEGQQGGGGDDEQSTLKITLLGKKEEARPFDVPVGQDGKFVFCPPGGGALGDFTDIVIDFSDDAETRCAVADQDGKMIGATRAENADFTFSDGGEEKPWAFLPKAEEDTVKVSKVVCDPAFKQITPEQLEKEREVNVFLREQAGQDRTQVQPLQFKGPFTGPQAVEEESKDADQGKNFASIEVEVGRLAPQGLRCAAGVDEGDAFRVAKRGENIDSTFSDADKGEWTFSKRNGEDRPATGIKNVVCDKDFKKGNFKSPKPAEGEMGMGQNQEGQPMGGGQPTEQEEDETNNQEGETNNQEGETNPVVENNQ